MNNLLIFNINDVKDKIVIEIDKESIDLGCFYVVSIILYLGSKEYILNIFDLYESTLVLQDVLKKALQNQLHLHYSINKDIGFMFNQDLYRSYQEREFSSESIIIYDADDNWIGYDYQIWGG